LSSFASQMADTQPRDATVSLHLPPGTGLPLGTFGWHWPGPDRSLHQLPAPHWPSLKQAAPHAPVTTLQKGPAWPMPQSGSTVHLPHSPSDAQYGSDELGQARGEPRPLSASHEEQTLETQMGLVPEQLALFSHSTHAPFCGPDTAQTRPCLQSVEMLGLQARQVALGMSHTGVLAAQTGQWETVRMRLHEPLNESPPTTVV